MSTPLRTATVTEYNGNYDLLIENSNSTLTCFPQISSLNDVLQTIQKEGLVALQWKANLSGLKIALKESNPAIGRIRLKFEENRDFYLKLIPSPSNCKTISYAKRSIQLTFVEDKASIIEKMNQFLAQIDLLFADGVVRKLIETNNDSRFNSPHSASADGYSNPPSTPDDSKTVRRSLTFTST